MTLLSHLKKYSALPLCLLLLVALSCSDTDTEQPEQLYGYAQFQITKDATRATADRLDDLTQAARLRVVLNHDGKAISQTLALTAYNDEAAEFGLQSDKLQLAAGDYSLTGFYIYNALDEEIYSDAGETRFEVVGGGLHYETLRVNGQQRGRVSFRLVKKFVETRAADAYPFSSIKGASVTLTNVFTHEVVSVEGLKVSVTSALEHPDEGPAIETSYGECDSLVWLPVGTWQVTDLKTYSDKRCRYLLEASTVSSPETFIVRANQTTEAAAVPVTMSKATERLKDYAALKAIWLALDGPHWYYRGEANTTGCNWDFDKDMDLWGDQPGVSLTSEGRVDVISIIGFGAKGVVPDEIGQLTELSVLYLGAHDETLGGVIGSELSAWDTEEYKARLRASYETMFLKKDGRLGLSEVLQENINRDSTQRPILDSRINLKDVQIGYHTNSITGISRAIKRCEQLQQLYIANAPITLEGFFRDIDQGSPFAAEDLKWENLSRLTDIEIYNCPELKGLPMEMLASLPELQVLNAAANRGISADQLLDDWNTLIDGNCGAKVQVIYFGFNNLEQTPPYDQLKRMTKLSALDLSHNKLRTIHPFGKEICIVKLYLNDNQLTSVPMAPDGYFSDYLDVEAMDFSYNRLTEVPDIFNAKSIYVIESVDFSHNNITALQNGAAFKGINASTVNLSYNHIEVFPTGLMTAGSPISSLVMTGNGLREIPEGSMTSPKTHYLRSLDLSNNSLSELPDDFYATNMPYLYGLDISGNRFESVPVKPLDNYSLTVYVVRNQRDDKGNRTLKGWPTGIYQHPQLRAFYVGGNDLRKIDDYISPDIYIFEIKDNPNISIDISTVCNYIQAGYYYLYYDKSQDIRGCDAIELDN